MRRFALLLLISILSCSSSSAQIIGLWQSEIGSSDYCISNHAAFDVYVFLEPDSNGAMAVEYKLILPDSNLFVAQAIQYNEFVRTDIIIGDPFSSIAMAFSSCQLSTVWVQKISFTNVTEPPVLGGEIRLSYPDWSWKTINVAICEDPRPLVEYFFTQPLYYTECDDVGNDECTWSAIKSLYR